MQGILPPDSFCFHLCFQHHLKHFYFPSEMLTTLDMLIFFFSKVNEARIKKYIVSLQGSLVGIFPVLLSRKDDKDKDDNW